jgi:uncharacterized protein (DUF433 family)
MDEKVLAGKPVVRGTRIPVSLVVGQLAAGETMESLTQDYHLEREDILACLEYAARVIAGEELRPLK